MDSNMFNYPSWLTNKKDTDKDKHKAAALVKQIEQAGTLAGIKSDATQAAARDLIEDVLQKINQAFFSPGMEFELYNLLAKFYQFGNPEAHAAMLIKAAEAIKRAS